MRALRQGTRVISGRGFTRLVTEGNFSVAKSADDHVRRLPPWRIRRNHDHARPYRGRTTEHGPERGSGLGSHARGRTRRGRVCSAPAAAAARRPAASNPVELFTDPSMNLQALFTAGATGYGAAEYGEVATAFNAVHRGGNSYNAFYDAFRSMGQLVSGFGQEALARRNHPAARGAFLRAASYLANPLYFARHQPPAAAAIGRLPGDERKLGTGRGAPGASGGAGAH